MKDEIKRKIKGYVYNEDDEKKILDYITNLQEENKELKKQHEEDIVYREEHLYLLQENKDLQDRIDKAIEYINNGYLSDGEMVNILARQDLLNLLQGKSDE